MATTASATEIIEDLVHIHGDRIRQYTEALHEYNYLELDLKAIFERVIEESTQYKQQLNEKIQPGNTVAGDIYKTWMTARTPLDPADKKHELLNSSEDEQAVLNAYSTALSSSALDTETREILQRQEQGLKELYTHLRHFHDAL